MMMSPLPALILGAEWGEGGCGGGEKHFCLFLSMD